MTVQTFDEVQYHGEVCHVEQTWDDPEGCHWCLIRPVETLDSGTYIVDQADVQQVHHDIMPARPAVDLVDAA